MVIYREHIIETINKLNRIQNVILEQILNLAMSNGYSHLKEVFEVGDVYSFSLGHFEDMKDVNVQKMEKLCRKTEEFFF